MHVRAAWVLVLATLVGGCWIKHLPDRPAPERRLPNIDNPAPPAEGLGHVAIDVEGGPARVERVIGDFKWSGTNNVHGAAITTVPVCVTPCLANLPFGAHDLTVKSVRDPDRNGRFSMTVGQRPGVVLVDPGVNRGSPGKVVGGALLLSAGVAILVGGLVTGNAILLGTAVGSTVGGLVLLAGSTIKQQPGVTQWAPDDGVVNAARQP